MFLFFPYSVDVPHEHRPVMNWLFVIAVVVVFGFQITMPSITELYCLDGWGIRGLLGSIWLHGSIWHLFWNSLFLWVFGNAICSKLGNLGYFATYIGLGVVSGIGYLLFSNVPLVGASGAISGLIGIYLVLFPENTISCFFWTIFMPLRAVWLTFRSFWFILLWFVLNIIGAIKGGSIIAYSAHITGFLAGMGLALLLLKTGNIKVEKYEKSILDLLGFTGKKPSPTDTGDRTHWQRKWEVQDRMKASMENSPTTPKPTTQKPIAQKPKPPKEPSIAFIRFKCFCGHPIKVPGIYAGRTGRCPKCAARLKVPPA